MKTSLVARILAVAISLGGTSAGLAQSTRTPDPGAVVVDAVLVRPACFVATVVGSTFFVISLPFAALSRSVHRTSQSLVVTPAKATFTRPLGDLDSLIPE